MTGFKMLFLVIARDGKDDKALDRRMAAREAHLKGCEPYLERGEHLLGAALLDDNGKMIGSMMFVNFPSRNELDTWLKTEPYVTGGVWKDIEVIPARVGPTFEKVFQK